jgi:hypothetical protein
MEKKHIGQSPSENPPPSLGRGSSISEDNAADPTTLITIISRLWTNCKPTAS